MVWCELVSYEATIRSSYIVGCPLSQATKLGYIQAVASGSLFTREVHHRANMKSVLLFASSLLLPAAAFVASPSSASTAAAVSRARSPTSPLRAGDDGASAGAWEDDIVVTLVPKFKIKEGMRDKYIELLPKFVELVRANVSSSRGASYRLSGGVASFFAFGVALSDFSPSRRISLSIIPTQEEETCVHYGFVSCNV